MTTPPVIRFDWERFHARVECLKAEQSNRTPTEAVAASLAAFRRWRVPPPASFVHTMTAVAAGRHDEPQAAGRA